METKMDVNYFIKKFEAIPESKIITNCLHDEFGGHCSLGWCMYNDKLTAESRALQSLFGFNCIAELNNGDNLLYQQPTAKQRILAFLYDIKAKQQPAEPKEKIIYKTVVIDTAVQKLQKQLTEN